MVTFDSVIAEFQADRDDAAVQVEHLETLLQGTESIEAASEALKVKRNAIYDKSHAVDDAIYVQVYGSHSNWNHGVLDPKFVPLAKKLELRLAEKHDGGYHTPIVLSDAQKMLFEELKRKAHSTPAYIQLEAEKRAVVEEEYAFREKHAVFFETQGALYSARERLNLYERRIILFKQEPHRITQYGKLAAEQKRLAAEREAETKQVEAALVELKKFLGLEA